MIIISQYKIKFIKLLRMLSIPRGHLVLDVGSGDGPFARANILCDKYITETENRVGPILIDRPFIAGDIMSLPFKDKAFDYIFCSHVLEHVESPEKAISELMRVGRRGFIEVPSEFLEKMKSSPGHKWYVSLDNGIMTFKEKERDVFDAFIQRVAEDRLLNKERSYMNFYWRNYYTLFNIGYEWSGDISFKVIRTPNSCLQGTIPIKGSEEKGECSISQEDEKATYRLQGIGRTRSLIKSLIKKMYSVNLDLLSLLACPICKGSLNLIEADLICYNCSKGFHVRDGIPILIEGKSFDI